MKILLTRLLGLAALLCSGAWAQTWTLYAPAERDFRVLVPDAPTRNNMPSGVEFRASGGGHQYLVFRHDPRLARDLAEARAFIIKRLSDDGSNQVRDRTDDDRSLAPNEFLFRTSAIRSLHRVVIEPGRFYELVVQTDEDDGPNRLAARDFFNSFHLGIGSGFAVLRNVPTPESCQARPNPFMRRFCEYATCLAPGQEANPVCTALPRLRSL